MQKNEEVSEFAAEEKIEQDITALIEKITNADGSELSELNYSPVELKKKFLPSEHFLEDEIKPRVVKYFNFINGLLKQKVEKENFNEAHIYDGDKVAVIFGDDGRVLAIGNTGDPRNWPLHLL